MAIRTRRGTKVEFDPNKLLQGEPATVIDDKKIKWCVAPGDVRTIATVEDMTQAISDANQPIIDELTAGANAVANVVEGVLDGVNNIIDSNGKYYTIKSSNGEMYLEELVPNPTPPKSETILGDITNLKNGKFDKSNIVQTAVVNDATKVPSSAVIYSLANQITAVDDKLVTMVLPSYTGLLTEELIDNFYNNYSASMANNTYYRANVNHGFFHSVIGGGSYYLEGVKADKDYEWQRITIYSTSNVNGYKRSKYAGVWSGWINDNLAVKPIALTAQPSVTEQYHIRAHVSGKTVTISGLINNVGTTLVNIFKVNDAAYCPSDECYGNGAIIDINGTVCSGTVMISILPDGTIRALAQNTSQAFIVFDLTYTLA